MQIFNPVIFAALAEVKNRGLNRFRCSLTGAPYATIDNEEIVLYLQLEHGMNRSHSPERLADAWEMHVLTLSSQPLPSLRSVNTAALASHILKGHQGHARIAVYMLSRLLFPNTFGKPLDSNQLIERAAFAREMHDWIVTCETGPLALLSQKLVAIDAYCAMPLWYELWAFDAAESRYSIHNAKAPVRKAFDEPESLIGNLPAIEAVITFMFELMLYVTQRDGVAGKSGSRMAQRALAIQTERMRVAGIPLHQKREISQADRERIAYQKAVAREAPIRVAHSAIHGKLYAPGENVGSIQAKARETARLIREAKESKAQARQATKTPASPKTGIKIDSERMRAMVSSFAANFGTALLSQKKD